MKVAINGVTDSIFIPNSLFLNPADEYVKLSYDSYCEIVDLFGVFVQKGDAVRNK